MSVKTVPSHYQTNYTQSVVEESSAPYYNVIPKAEEKLAFEIRDNSMSPVLKPGDELLCRGIDLNKLSAGFVNTIMCIVYDKEVKVGVVKSYNKDGVVLSYINPTYSDTEISLDNIKELWIYEEFKSKRPLI